MGSVAPRGRTRKRQLRQFRCGLPHRLLRRWPGQLRPQAVADHRESSVPRSLSAPGPARIAARRQRLRAHPLLRCHHARGRAPSATPDRDSRRCPVRILPRPRHRDDHLRHRRLPHSHHAVAALAAAAARAAQQISGRYRGGGRHRDFRRDARPLARDASNRRRRARRAARSRPAQPRRCRHRCTNRGEGWSCATGLAPRNEKRTC